MTTERERYFHEIPDERFKTWARARHGLPIRPSDGDKQALIMGEWAAWQAALAQPAQPVALVSDLCKLSDYLAACPLPNYKHYATLVARAALALEKAAPQPAPVADTAPSTLSAPAAELSDADVTWVNAMQEAFADPNDGVALTFEVFTRLCNLARAGRATVAEDAARYRVVQFEREYGPDKTHFRVFKRWTQPHSETGEPVVWQQALHGPALDAAIDAARGAP